MELKSTHSHSLNGIFYFDLPIGVLLAIIFHFCVKISFIPNLPFALSERFEPIRVFDWLSYFKAKWYIVFLSVLLGAFSHVLWDSFTHLNGFFVEEMDWTKGTFLGVERYRVLQHASTLFGALYILKIVISLPRNTLHNHTINLRYWLLVVILSGASTSLSLMLSNAFRFGDVIVVLIS